MTQHTIVNRRLDVRVYRATLAASEPERRNLRSARWFSAAALASGAVPTLTRKIASAAGFPERRGRRILEARCEVAAVLSLLAVLADTPVTIPAQMRLKDGTVYELKAPPYLKNGRFVFTTHDGKVLSLAEIEVDEIKLLPPSAPGRRLRIPTIPASSAPSPGSSAARRAPTRCWPRPRRRARRKARAR